MQELAFKKCAASCCSYTNMGPHCLARLARASLLWCIVEVDIDIVMCASLDLPAYFSNTAGPLMRPPTPKHTLPLSDVWRPLLPNLHGARPKMYADPGLFCSNRYGFVEFDDPRDADDAVYDLNGKELCGERVIVEHTKGPRRDGGYGGGGGGGRSKCPLGRLNSHVLSFITGIQ